MKEYSERSIEVDSYCSSSGWIILVDGNEEKIGSYQNHQQKNKENLILILLHLYYGGLHSLLMSESFVGEFELPLIHDVVRTFR